VRPVKGQILTLRQAPGDPLVGRTLRGLVRGSSIYLVPRDDGRVAVGATAIQSPLRGRYLPKNIRIAAAAAGMAGISQACSMPIFYVALRYRIVVTT
jgi:glycine/D-amino acid oxidase-like deaminating enzyme